MAHDVFISFSFKDQEIAEKIVNQLTNKYGISCWISANDIQLASNYYSQIANAIHDAKVVVFLQSKIQGRWTRLCILNSGRDLLPAIGPSI